MRRLTIRTSLIIIFGLFAIICATFAATTQTALKTLYSSSNLIAYGSLPSVNIARAVESEALKLRLAYLAHVTSKTAEAQSAAEAAIATQVRSTFATLDKYQPFVTTDAERRHLGLMREKFEAYDKLGAATLAASRARDVDATMTAIAAQREVIEPVMQAIEQLVQENVNDAATVVQAAEDSYTTATNVVFTVLAIAALLTVGAAIYGLSNIARPIRSLTASMRKLAEGDTGSSIPFTGRSNELGQMADAVEIFRQAAVEKERLEAEALEARQRAESERQHIQAAAEAAAQARLDEATAGLAAGLRRLAAGDLSFRLDEPFAPDFEQLRADLNAAVAELGSTLTAVSGAVQSIESGTQEISGATNDLSRRTEQQAASLEETAAALDQITANVSNSAKRAVEAQGIAADANTSAAKSGQIVADAVAAMQRIESSSEQIAGIIGVIDEIAFQTNLLALNAGVEAARAGEAGKGFAVVAQEVRELAQRSAKAAREIKDLIRNSTAEVGSGVHLVSATGSALREIGTQIAAINDHVGAIAASAREQSIGLGEVNTAVNQLDQVTQQNAAMVEENSAASHRLAQEGAHLNTLVGRFTLAQQSEPAQRQRAILRAA